MNYGPPIQLPVSPFRRGTGIIKVKRGGTGKVSNSGNATPRFYTPNACLREAKKGNKKGTHHGGKVLPPEPSAKPVWDPRDPFIIAFQQGGYEDFGRVAA